MQQFTKTDPFPEPSGEGGIIVCANFAIFNHNDMHCYGRMSKAFRLPVVPIEGAYLHVGLGGLNVLELEVDEVNHVVDVEGLDPLQQTAIVLENVHAEDVDCDTPNEVVSLFTAHGWRFSAWPG